MKKSRTLRLTRDRLSELTPAELTGLAAGHGMTEPTTCVDCIVTRHLRTIALVSDPNNLFTLYTC